MKELKDEISRLHADNVTLQAGYDAARLEIDHLRGVTKMVETAQPVAWQSRTRPTWGSNTTPWSPWESCTKEQAEDYWKTPLLHDWAYEARALCIAPQAARAAAAGPSEAPEGWRNKFAEAVYADLEAADNQDVPLEEYPARILKALDSIVGPRHPTVIHWRNDAIQACIAIAYKYCRDPESFQYLKQDLQSLIFAAPKVAPVAQGDARAEQALLKVLAAVQRYLPPDGPSAKDTLAEIIGIIDPWPLGYQKGKA